MNYHRMIELLLFVKTLRIEGKNSSPYVCDNLAEPGVLDTGAYDVEINKIREDIHQKIEKRYSVPVFLGLDREEHQDPRVLEFRMQLIDDLIHTYTVAWFAQELA